VYVAVGSGVVTAGLGWLIGLFFLAVLILAFFILVFFVLVFFALRFFAMELPLHLFESSQTIRFAYTVSARFPGVFTAPLIVNSRTHHRGHGSAADSRRASAHAPTQDLMAVPWRQSADRDG
jgi:hypothetical protein